MSKIALELMTFPFNLTLTCYFETLFSRDVYSHKRCYVNNEVSSVTPCLT